MERLTNIQSMPLAERPREKMLRLGRNELSNAELLAILLRTGSKGESAIMVASNVLGLSNEGIGFLGKCTVEELIEINGIGQSKACQILAAIELGFRLSKHSFTKRGKISTPDDVFKIFEQELRYEAKEKFIAVLLNTKNEITSTEIISIGSINSSIVHPREVFNIAIKKSAAAMVLVHNHPSGDPKPSYEDVKVTDRLVEVGKLVGIKVIDHIIVGDKIYYSFKEKELL